ncbi:hypothetical protein MKY92_25130 [Paenibacillus sp. FSL R5-0623]|uniref:hypothetical protein n=1 Tax=Paenibacillus sp. FSL R5-0623 TaxID=2921651 RepID=UPI0030DA9213
MDYKQLRNEIEQVQSSVNHILEYLTDRTIEDLRTRRRSKEVDINVFNMSDNPNIVTSTDFFSVFREEVGIYLFEANFSEYYDYWLKNTECLTLATVKHKWFEQLKRLWDGVDNSPTFYKRRAEYHYISDEQNKFKNAWIPLYIGKSKNVQSRVNEHIEGRFQKTYGMKLRHRDALKNGIQFRVSYSPLNELEDDTLYELVKVIENNVRAIFNPIVGKK